MKMTSKILIVDDEPGIRKTLERNLRRAFRSKGGEVEIRQAENGEEGVKLAREDRPDLILLDIRMPIMDGMQACGILRSNPLFDPTVIIILTAEATAEVKGLSTGADDYITKPFDTAVLLLRVEKGLQTASHRNVVIQDPGTGLWSRSYFENCRIEGEVGRARRFGRPLTLFLSRLEGLEDATKDDQGVDGAIKKLLEFIPNRESDISVRWDENTIATLLPETGREAATLVAQRFNDQVKGYNEKITPHIGISCLDAENQIEALASFAETSLMVAQDTRQIVINGTPL
jgi:DNA-binding response OmpR family regulator